MQPPRIETGGAAGQIVSAKKRGRPLGSGKTEQVAIRVPADALAKWRASGRGWQTRAAALLTRHAPKANIPY